MISPVLKILVLFILAGMVLGINYILNAFTEIKKGDVSTGFFLLAKGLLGGVGKLDDYLYEQATKYIIPCKNNYNSTYCVENGITPDVVKARFCGYAIAFILEVLIILAFISLTIDIAKHLASGVIKIIIILFFIIIWILIFATITDNFKGLSTAPEVFGGINITNQKVNVNKTAIIEF